MPEQNSRYHGQARIRERGPDGQVILYLSRRFLPASDDLAILSRTHFKANERLDNMSARVFGDPLQYWRLCDANNAMNPRIFAEQHEGSILIPMPWQHTGPMRPNKPLGQA